MSPLASLSSGVIGMIDERSNIFRLVCLGFFFSNLTGVFTLQHDSVPTSTYCQYKAVKPFSKQPIHQTRRKI
jgi:hypothetical protein